MTIRRVLLVCSGNTCRSPMAAALLQALWEKAGAPWPLQISSAGTSAFPGSGASEFAVEAVRRRGIDLAQHVSRAITAEMLPGVDLILTMTLAQREQVLRLRPDLHARLHTLGDYAGMGSDVPDPFGGTLQQYEQTAERLGQMLRAAVKRIQDEGDRA